MRDYAKFTFSTVIYIYIYIYILTYEIYYVAQGVIQSHYTSHVKVHLCLGGKYHKCVHINMGMHWLIHSYDFPSAFPPIFLGQVYN